MTNLEAIAELKDIFINVLEEPDKITAMAFRLATEALESIDRVTAERDAAIADIEDIAKSVNVNCRYCKNLSEKISCFVMKQ